MLFDKKKLANVVIAVGGGQSKKKGGGDDYESVTMDGMNLAMDAFIKAVHAKDITKANNALKAWTKLCKSYGDFTKPEDIEKA